MQIVSSNYTEMADMNYTKSMEPFILEGVMLTGEEIGKSEYGTAHSEVLQC